MGNQRGFGLVQVLVTVAIMGVVLTAVATMMVTQMQETKAMTEKLAVLDIQKSLSNNLAKADVCSFNVLRSTSIAFDSGANPIPNIQLDNALYAGAGVNSPIFIEKNKAPSVISSNVVVDSLWLTNIRCNPMPCVASNNTFLANVEARLKSGGMVRQVRPPTTEITVTTTGAGSSKTIAGCYGAVVATELTCVNLSNGHYVVACPPGWALTGGGCHLGSGYNETLQGITVLPNSPNSYNCSGWRNSGGTNVYGAAYAICCKIQ